MVPCKYFLPNFPHSNATTTPLRLSDRNHRTPGRTRAIVRAALQKARVVALPAKHLPLAGCSILLVENEPAIALSIADCLQDAGALVLTAWSTSDALRIAEDHHFSAAVLDLDLGGDNSTIVCERLTERAIPFLFYSGYDHAYVCDKWPNATTVPKPAGEQVLISALCELIRRCLAATAPPTKNS